MRFTFSFQKSDSLSSLCNMIISSRIAACKCWLLLKNDPDWISQGFCGNVEEPIFLKLIDKSAKNKLMQDLLVSIVDAADAECITDRVFEKLTAFPKMLMREKLIVSLCHKRLSETQLSFLCNIGTQFECFFELSIIYYTDSSYSLDHMAALFEAFKKCRFGYMYTELLTELLDCYKASADEKRLFALDELSAT